MRRKGRQVCSSAKGSRIIATLQRLPVVAGIGTYQKDIVRKLFKLNIEGKHRDRVLDATKHEIRQYVKRERRKPLPEGVDFWDFDCKFGASQEVAERVHFANITALIDASAKEGAQVFYLEMIAKPGFRKARPPGEAGDDTP